MTWKPRYEGEAYPFEIVCPDGFVRHFSYTNREDAESDAKFASESSCQFQKQQSRLELAFGSCGGGVHTVRKRDSEGGSS